MTSDKQHNPHETSAPICEIATEKADIKPFILVIFGGSGDLSRRMRRYPFILE